MKNFIHALLLTSCVLLLCACGAEPEGDTATQAPTETPTAAPEPEPVTLIFPDGSEHRADEARLDLSGLKPGQVKETAALLAQMPALRSVDLGDESGGLVPEDVLLLQEACPEAELLWRFTLFEREFTTLDESMDLNHVPMDDEGEAVRAVLPLMRRCKVLDMDSCGVSDEAMARIRDENPDMDVVWRIWFGVDCSVRTDVERILASSPQHRLTAENTRSLQYCTNLRLLDIGHNELLFDYSFLSSMTELEVAILGISALKDLTPISACTKLEYLEINSNCWGIDLTPLAPLKQLKHLNICWLGEVQGWEALCELTSLERLWIGKLTKIPEEGLEQIRAALPDTEINTTELTGCGGTWRIAPDGSLVPRYALLRQQFDYDHYSTACSSWWNDPLYDPPKEEGKTA